MTNWVLSDDVKGAVEKTIRETLGRSRPGHGNAGRWHKKGGSGGGSVMHFTVSDCDATYYYVTATEYTGGCGDPPGKDDYTGLWTVTKLACTAPWTVAQIEAGEIYGVAAYTYPVGGSPCTPFWKEISTCGPAGC